VSGARRGVVFSRLHAAVFLLSLLALLFQFAQTRLFSASLDYHLTFLVLSGALLGVGAGATLSAVVDRRARRPGSASLAIGAALATLAALFVETRVDPLLGGSLVAVAAGYVLGVVPLLFVSWVIVRALREAPAAGGGLYAADLSGAAVGALIGYLTIGALGAQGLYGLAAASAFAAAALLGPRRRILRATLGVAAIASVVVLAVFGETIARPLPGPLKTPDAGSTHDLGRWDPLARIDVSRAGAAGDAAQYAFLIDSAYSGLRPAALAMQLDMGALTPIVAGGTSTDLAVLDASILAAPYELAPRSSVLVMGPGGGIDLLVALHRGASVVSGVEVNRTEVALMRGAYADYSGGVYLDPRVHIYEDEARSFIRRSPDRYDLIPITVVDSFAALSAGAYALTENYLYTEEAMRDYLVHLAPGGAVAMSRWFRDPPVEIIRALSVADAALRELGNTDPQRSMVVLRYGNFGLMMIRREPYTEPEMAKLRAFAEVHGFSVALDPLAPAGVLAIPSREAPPVDDRPFFFDTVPFSEVLSGQAPMPYGYGVLVVTLLLSLSLAAGGVLLPVYRPARLAGGAIVPPGTAVALAVGFGFIGAEVVLLQRLTLYLGQPALALSIGLAALLAGAASGSALSTRVPGGIRGSALASASVLIVMLGGLAVLTDATLAAPLVVRVSIGVLAAFLVGLPLGTVFPRLIARVGAIDPMLVSWVWAANGSASVVGAILGTVVALVAGFTALGAAAAACYLVAAAAWRPAKRM
jgi:hypothetical protein